MQEQIAIVTFGDPRDNFKFISSSVISTALKCALKKDTKNGLIRDVREVKFINRKKWNQKIERDLSDVESFLKNG
jgi:hypothetical protein